MATSTRDLAILLLEGGCSRLFLPPSAGEELYAFLEMCRENEASRQDISPSSKLDALWHWMLLNTDVSTRVHEALGGIVPHTTSTESDPLEKKNKRRKLAMKLMHSMGHSPNPDLWDDDSGNKRRTRKGDDSDGLRSRKKRKDGKAFLVNVRLPSRERILVKATACTTLEELRRAIEDRVGIPQDEQLLVYEGERMSKATFGDCGVVHGADIDVLVQQYGC